MGVLEAQNGQRSPEQVGAGAPSSKVSESTFSFRQGLLLLTLVLDTIIYDRELLLLTDLVREKNTILNLRSFTTSEQAGDPVLQGVSRVLNVRRAHPIVPSDKMKLVLTRSALLLHCRSSIVFVSEQVALVTFSKRSVYFLCSHDQRTCFFLILLP